jgi:O-antigen/teichoic acid export membrane protein
LANNIEHIGKKDIIWSYVATIFRVGAGIILWPFILSQMSAETVGIWNVMITIMGFVALLDFGFQPSFARNISYIFSGVTKLQKVGIQTAVSDGNINFSLLKGTLNAMRKFYRWMALGVFVILGIAGTAYFYYILQKYSGDRTDAMIAWILLIAINSYNVYTLYYNALLLGKGYIRRERQIMILSQCVYLSLAIVLIYAGYGLTAIVSSQAVSIILQRILSYRVFFTKELKQQLLHTEADETKDILKAISPNAVKVGLTQLGGFCVTKSALLIGSAFLTLEETACYGITLHIIDILARCSTVYYQSITPKIAQSRANKDVIKLKYYFVCSIGILVATFLLGGAAIAFLGNWGLNMIGSETKFLPTIMLCVMLLVYLLETNHSIAAGFISADNRIPFFIPSLLSGLGTVVLLWLFLSIFKWGVWGMILSQGIAQLVYQNWKWPSMVIKELNIR